MNPKEKAEIRRILNKGYLLFYKGAIYGVQRHSQLIAVESIVFALVNYAPEVIQRDLPDIQLKRLGQHPVNVTTATKVREFEKEISKYRDAYAKQKKQAMILFSKAEVKDENAG